MLFPYTYVPHQLEKMQEFIDFIFFEVWCKAPTTKSYSLDLFASKPQLWEVMRDFCFSDPQPAGAKFFCEHIEQIYKLFSTLSLGHITQFKYWYKCNNDLEKACANDSTIKVARYIEIQAIHPELGKLIAAFFRGLYDKSLLGLADLESKIGTMSQHSKAFFSVNKEGKCPFCGINDLKGIHHTRREAYDHYLPKFRYPFNSVNFHNLAPTCHECNSTYKLSKDPAYAPKISKVASVRRKFFYPYTKKNQAIELQVILQSSDIDRLAPEDISLQFGPQAIREEIDTWREVYGIEERYKAKFCTENDGKYWLAQILDEWKEDHRTPADFLNTLARQTTKSPYAECNFLKKAFLEACNQRGVFNALP